MKGEERCLGNLLEGKRTRFLVPVYQRNYDWKIEHCKRLFDDLVALASGEEASHFFGSIVSKADAEVREVIDGQQRITTSYLLFLAIVKQLRDGVITAEDESISQMIEETYLIDKYHKAEVKLKLKLVKDDQAAFEAIYNGDESKFIPDSNVTQNYYYFCERLADMHISVDELVEAIEDHLIVIDIQLQQEDDAQRIFESLNSTGLELSEGDKIRNFLLMDLDPEEQENYYDNYWNPIEKNTDYDVSTFIRAWLAAVRRKTPRSSQVYETFKEYVKANEIAIDDLMVDLLRYSEYFKTITTASTGNEELDVVLRRLALLNRTVTYTYLLNLFDYRYSGSIDDGEISEALQVVESYLFRRWVCNVATNALNKVFLTLHSEVLRGVAEGGTYSDVLKKVLLSKETSGRFPGDNEFEEEFNKRNFYDIPSSTRDYLYDRLENGDNRERVNVVQGLRDETFSVEHIMPQTLTSAWKTYLGDNYEEIHDTWLHKMANLTLTAYNSKYSNKPFVDKRDMENGFKDSHFHINYFVSQQDEWTEIQLQERQELLLKRFLELWPMISSSFEWSHDAYEEHALDDDFDFTNRKIVAYSFMGSRFSVTSWVDMTRGVLPMVYDLNPVIFYKYLPDEADFPGSYFSREEAEYTLKLADNIYYHQGSSTQTKIEILRIVLDDAGIDPSELVFELRKDAIEE